MTLSQRELNQKPITNDLLFQHLVESVSEYAIFTVDSLGRILTWNSGAQRLLLYEEKEVVGLSYELFFLTNDRDKKIPQANLQSAISNGSAQEERWLRRKDNTRFWAQTVLTPIFDPEHRLVGFSNLIRDSSDRRKFATTIQELERFTYVASHDLKEPLRMIGTYVQLLDRRYGTHLPVEGKQYVSTAVEGVKRMYQLIDDILTFTKISANVVTWERLSCDDVVGQALSNLSGVISQTHAIIRLGKLPSIYGCKIALTHVFENLISNAIKFCDRRPDISVQARLHDDQWVFSIKDNGIGISPEFADKLFIIFRRLHRHEDYSGTGTGLAICKKLVEQHHGKIWFESTPGEGSAFYFTVKRDLREEVASAARNDTENSETPPQNFPPERESR